MTTSLMALSAAASHSGAWGDGMAECPVEINTLAAPSASNEFFNAPL
jgi:hypothetical protein